MRTSHEIKTLSEAMPLVGDYHTFFTDKFMSEHLPSLSTRLKSAKTASSKESLALEAGDWMTVYCLIIYKLFPVNGKLQKTISSSDELKSNFDRMKSFLDGHEGEKLAEQFLGG